MTSQHAKTGGVLDELSQLYSQSHSFNITPWQRRMFVNRLNYMKAQRNDLAAIANPADSDISSVLTMLIELGLPQRYLADRLQTSTSALNRWVKGTQPPRAIVKNMIIIEAQRILDDIIAIGERKVEAFTEQAA